MAYESVKNQIDAYIKANGVNLITGPVLNAVLTTMLDELGEGYAFQGVLNTTDTPSPAADIPQAWLASAGTYLGGSITVDEGELALIIHAADGWSKETVYRGVQLSDEAIVAALGYTPADDADLAKKQDAIADLSAIRSGAALGSTSVQPVDIENMVEAEPIGSIVPPVNPSEFATKESVDELYGDLNGMALVWTPGYINSSGSFVQPDGYSQITSQKLSASQANGIKITFGGTYCIRLAYFNGDTLVSRSAILESDSSPYTIETEYSVYISLVTKYPSSYTQEQMLGNYIITTPGGLIPKVSKLESFVEEISPVADNLKSTVYGVQFVWTSGNISDTGAIISPTQSNYYSQIIPNAEVNGIRLKVDDGYLCNVAFYSNGVFVSRYGWIYAHTGEVTISTLYDARIMIGISAEDNTKTAEQIVPHIHIYNLDEGLEKRVEKLESASNSSYFLAKMLACDFDGKILHFSFDDACWCLNDLIQNAESYTTIFDEPFFGMLKEVHDSTGMVFTLNTFNEIDTNTSGYYPTGFDISDVPTKFQSDFQANKGWLKFSFHAKDENTNYNTASGAGTDYGVFVSAIYTLTGDYDCIDRVTRLGYFGGTKENCLALRDAEHGIVGFLCADDDRAYDYYLTSDQYSWLRKKGKIFDENGVFFIKTQSRTFTTGKQDVENNLCFQKVTEFFTHEYEAHYGALWDLTAMKNNILSLASWASGLGYKFGFAEQIFG